MRRALLVAFVLMVVPLSGGSRGEDEFTSWPQKVTIEPGLHGKIGPSKCISVLMCNGPWAGQKQCPFCTAGGNPYVAVFARETSEGLTSLVRKVDAAAVANAKVATSAFVIVYSEADKMEATLTDLAKKEGLKKCEIALSQSKAGPRGYDLHPAADVTVALVVSGKARAQYAFKPGELKEKDIEAILADLPNILPKRG